MSVQTGSNSKTDGQSPKYEAFIHDMSLNQHESKEESYSWPKLVGARVNLYQEQKMDLSLIQYKM